jgi:hypothetical protein
VETVPNILKERRIRVLNIVNDCKGLWQEVLDRFEAEQISNLEARRREKWGC